MRTINKVYIHLHSVRKHNCIWKQIFRIFKPPSGSRFVAHSSRFFARRSCARDPRNFRSPFMAPRRDVTAFIRAYVIQRKKSRDENSGACRRRKSPSKRRDTLDAIFACTRRMQLSMNHRGTSSKPPSWHQDVDLFSDRDRNLCAHSRWKISMQCVSVVFWTRQLNSELCKSDEIIWGFVGPRGIAVRQYVFPHSR